MIDCVKVPDILLPRAGTGLSKWSVVACDQFTSQPEYWREADGIVGDAPSTLRLIYPEAYLLMEREPDRAPAIHAAMRSYLDGGVFAPAHHGFILTERTTKSGARLGLMLCIDLQAYDFSPGAKALIRPTEGTILDRIPPRVRVRKDAPLELPHVMLLANDPQRTLIEPLYEQRDGLQKLYDFDLMLGGGHLRGWAVNDEENVYAALENLLPMDGDPILFAVGDGNHSLATARQCYLDNPSEATRYALVEVVNLFSDALVFEPIHRLIENVDADALRKAMEARGILPDGDDVRVVQPFLDEWLPATAKVDYIHGDEALAKLSARDGAVGIRLSPIDKATLFPSLAGGQVLPRKAFSMGEAEEKRYYMECRALR